MKLSAHLAAGLIAFGCTSALFAQDTKITVPGVTPPASPAPAAPTLTDQQILEVWGWYFAQNTGLASLGLTDTEVTALGKGIAAAAQGQPPAFDIQKVGPQVEKFLTARHDSVISTLKQKNSADAAAYFGDLKKNAKVVVLPSGLCYEILKPGSGLFPKVGQTVKVHYTGTLLNGTVFDSSVQRGEPVDFPLDAGLIPAWIEGIQKINKGGKIKLYVPSSLAYGDEGRPGIPPASALIFEVELLDIKDTPPPAPGAAPAGAPAPDKQ